MEAQLPKDEESSDFANQDVHLPENDPGVSAYDLAWQALHAAAAAACRGSTPTGGSGSWVNIVLSRNSAGTKSCKQLCIESKYWTICDAELSIYGKKGKATTNGQGVGSFYNYKCTAARQSYGGNEALARQEEIFSFGRGAYSYCCCRK